MTDIPPPSNWPALPSEFEGDAAAEWYWQRYCCEIDRRGYLIKADVLVISLVVNASLYRDAVLSDWKQSSGETKRALESELERCKESLSNLMDACMLPPGFANVSLEDQ